MLIIETCIKTVDFYDTSDTIKEQLVTKHIHDATYRADVILRSIWLRVGNCCVINNTTGEEINFDNSDAFESWKATISLSELTNCVIVLQSENANSKTTIEYHFDEATSKRIKLYNFEVLERDTGKRVPAFSFKTDKCLLGLAQITDIVEAKYEAFTKHNYTVLLNGFDITDYFIYSDKLDVRCQHKEEKNYAEFLIIYIGLNERKKGLKAKIAGLKKVKATILEMRSSGINSDEIDEAELNTDKGLQALEDQLKAIDNS